MLFPLLTGLFSGGRGRSAEEDDPIKQQAELNKKLSWDSYHTTNEGLKYPPIFEALAA